MPNPKDAQLIHAFFAFFGLTKDQIELTEEGETITIVLQVDPSETGRFIGHFAATLDSLQLLVSILLNHDQEIHRHVALDVGGYRQERLAVLKNMAEQASAEVEATGLPHSLPPLSAIDRRQIHLLFQDHATLTTYSEGEGQSRRLIIAPKTG